jgi:Ca2+-binding RTX toxin-like protein
MAAVEDTLSAIENVIGGGGSDVIAGNNAANTIEGGLGDDTLSGNGGADTILGGEGNDVIEGGKSNDTLLGEAGDDMFIFTIGDGTDSVDGGIDLDTLSIFGTASNNTLDVIFDGVGITAFEGGALTGVEAVIADLLDGADRLNYDGTTADIEVDLSTGAASGFASIANIENVTGGSGNDIFTGDALVNNFAGRAGDDTYFVEFGDTINEAADGGIDTVFTDSGSFNLSGNVENLTYTGASNFVGAGNGSDNVITGGSDTDVLDGNGGADTLIGGAGADVLSGGAGDDLLFGGTGDDLMNGNAGNDMFVFDSLGFGDDIIQGFDANPTNGQDLLDFTLLGITADDFADRVDVVDIGSATQVTVDGGTAMGGGSILLLGVNGNGANAIDIDDFILMA